ncbi:MAG: peptidoglycan D,D-transpeptidase FtsI family protein, partial [Planctomycetaceae bacterium]
LFVVPSRIRKPWQVALQLAETLEVDPDALFVRMARHQDKDFLWVKRRLTDSEAERVRSLDLPPEVWGFRQEYLRRYPQGPLAAHVLGLRDIDGIGRGGIEESCDAPLRGRDGQRVLVRDALGKVIDVREEVAQPPEDGRTIVLTIDAVIQLYAERELDALMSEWKPHSACVIVMDPDTAEVLAMASRPAFDPNDPAGVPEAAWKNTAIAAIYEPGSTFKPFVVAWGIEKGLIKRDETFHCENGVYRMGRRILHDHHPYGELSVTDVLVKSSNIGMAKIGERLTNRELYNATVAFGFGSPTGVELPGEVVGTVRPLDEWTGYSTGSVPMGHEIAVTPLQLITAHAALAGDGLLRRPRLVLCEMEGPGGAARGLSHASIYSPTVGAETCRWLIEGPMTEVVRRGTGTKGRLDGYTVFAKTGTAQKLDPATGGYSTSRHVGSFLCGAPAEDPRVLVLVVVDEPAAAGSQYGGTVAAPTAARILEQTLIHLRVPKSELAERDDSAPQ